MRLLHRPTILFALTMIFLILVSPVSAVSPMIEGRAWIDTNCDGMYQDNEPPTLQLFAIYLYRFGADGIAFTSDDRQVRNIDLYTSGPSLGSYRDDTDSAVVLDALPNERYRLSILQGGRPAGYVPTLYRQGNDPARWSSLQSNWTTGDPEDNGFVLDLNSTVTGGNIGIAPVSCVAQWYSERVYLPLLGS